MSLITSLNFFTLDSKFQDNDFADFFDDTIRTNLLNWCNLASISKNVVRIHYENKLTKNIRPIY